jgi:RimJ/RimL family protein N-acetyltransferase
MHVRDVSWEDFPSVARNYLDLYDEVLEAPDLGMHLFAQRPTLAEESTWFARLFKAVQEGSSVGVVAEEEGRVIGLCEVARKGVSPESHHVGVLGILVARGFRGRGAGRAMMQLALEKCKGKFEIVELTVMAWNPRARKLYESLGFRCFGTLPRGLKRDGRYTDVDHMVLELA